jgi:hypothetical protein
MAEFENIKWMITQMLAAITPALLIIICSLCSFITFIVCRKIIFRKYGVVMTKYPHFWELQLPKSASWILALLYISTYFISDSPIAGAIINVILIICAMYFICGISTIDFFFKKKGLHWSIRIILYAISFFILLLFGIAYFGFILIGVIDSSFDFRRIRARRSEI